MNVFNFYGAVYGDIKGIADDDGALARGVGADAILLGGDGLGDAAGLAAARQARLDALVAAGALDASVLDLDLGLAGGLGPLGLGGLGLRGLDGLGLGLGGLGAQGLVLGGDDLSLAGLGGAGDQLRE